MWDDNVSMGLIETGCLWPGFRWLVEHQVASCYEYGNEISTSINDGRFINHPNDSQFVEVSGAFKLIS